MSNSTRNNDKWTTKSADQGLNSNSSLIQSGDYVKGIPSALVLNSPPPNFQDRAQPAPVSYPYLPTLGQGVNSAINPSTSDQTGINANQPQSKPLFFDSFQSEVHAPNHFQGDLPNINRSLSISSNLQTHQLPNMHPSSSESSNLQTHQLPNMHPSSSESSNLQTHQLPSMYPSFSESSNLQVDHPQQNLVEHSAFDSNLHQRQLLGNQSSQVPGIEEPHRQDLNAARETAPLDFQQRVSILESQNGPQNSFLDPPGNRNRECFQIFNEEINSEAYPTTTSKHWFAIETLKNEAKFRTDYANFVDKLKEEYLIQGWKRSRGDGSCYYRAVIHSYLEKVCKPHNNLSLDSFMRVLRNESCISEGNRLHQETKERVLEVLVHISNVSLKSPLEGFKQICKWLQIDSFDKDLVMCLRMITADYMFKHQQDEDIFPYLIDGIQEAWESILKTDEEAEGIALILVPKALGVQVIQYHYFNIVKEERFPFGECQESPKLFIMIKSKGHYDMLYHRDEWERDGYYFQYGFYHMLMS